MLAGILTGGVKLVFALLALIVGVAFFAFWLWMLVDCIRNKRLSDGEKVAWILAIVLLHALGALIYLIFGRSKQT